MSNPTIFAMSNPTIALVFFFLFFGLISNVTAECTPIDAFKYAGENTIFASGSPFENVPLGNGKVGYVNQANKMYTTFRKIHKEKDAEPSEFDVFCCTVHGMEYGFGAHDYSSSGVFEVEPRSCPGFIFRRSLWLGSTDMSQSEFRLFIEQLSEKYHGNTYHLIAKNCNHFTNDVCMLLTGKPIPGWVNRLAKLGSYCNCLLPENIQIAAVRHCPEHLELSDGSESIASSAMGDSDGDDDIDDDDEPHQRLLAAPTVDPVTPREKPVKLARDLL